MEYLKAKSAAKTVLPRNIVLESAIAAEMAKISAIVGGTLGPGGRPVLIERPESGLPPMITKDGVTVFRSLGESDAVAHCIMETARDAAVRTATEAGDGTTTATILSESIMRFTNQLCKNNPQYSPQRVVRRLHEILVDHIVPELERQAVTVTLNSVSHDASNKEREMNDAVKDFTELLNGSDGVPNATVVKKNPSKIYLDKRLDWHTSGDRSLAHAVACISGNGDEPLADAVMDSFDICGDSGNVTIVDLPGSPSRYEVEKIEGYPIGMGYEISCSRFYPAFINDPGTQRCVLENPIFILYYGKVSDTQTMVRLLRDLQHTWAPSSTGDSAGHAGTATPSQLKSHNVVVIATGFSEMVLSELARNFTNPGSLNVFPLIVPQDSPIPNAPKHFLDDIAAVTGGQVFDQITKPLNTAKFQELGNLQWVPERSCWEPRGIRLFECNRYRSSIIGNVDEDLLLLRADEVQSMIDNAISELDKSLAQERLAKLTGGIAKLRVIGASTGELKERRDRAEDAICAVRGALKFGCLPGGGWALVHLMRSLPADPIVEQVLIPAFKEPLYRLYENAGLPPDEVKETFQKMFESANVDSENAITYDCLNQCWEVALDKGIVDSFPAVLEAIRNSISIAALLGTLGGCVVQPRHQGFEASESRDAADFERNSNFDPHDR